METVRLPKYIQQENKLSNYFKLLSHHLRIPSDGRTKRYIRGSKSKAVVEVDFDLHMHGQLWRSTFNQHVSNTQYSMAERGTLNPNWVSRRQNGKFHYESRDKRHQKTMVEKKQASKVRNALDPCSKSEHASEVPLTATRYR